MTRTTNAKTISTSAWLAVLGALGALGALAVACGSSPPAKASSGSSSSGGGGSEEAGAPALGADDGGDGSAEDAAGPAPQTFVRIAQVSPDSPALDVCVAPHGTTAFQGPLVGQLAASFADDAGADDAAAVGLTYTQVSAYIPLTPGQYDVRLVAAGAASCDAPLASARGVLVVEDVEDASSADAASSDDAGAPDAGPVDASVVNDASSPPVDAGEVDAGDASAPGSDWTSLPSLAFNTYTTLLVAGDLSPAGNDAPLTVTMLPDDAVLAGGNAVLRAVNAVPSCPSLDFGLSSISQWMPLLTDVGFATASAQAAPGDGVVDANGYLPIAPLDGQAMSASPTDSDAGADAGVVTASAANIEIDQGSIATVLAIGGKTGDTANPPALLLCMDNQPAGGLLSDCSVAQ
jgi:hypothetical protein